MFGYGALKITNCKFSNNRAVVGGAVHFYGSELGFYPSWIPRLDISGSVFEANRSEGQMDLFGNKTLVDAGLGGALVCQGPTHISSTDFRGNSSLVNGGAASIDGYLSMANTRFIENSAGIEAGALETSIYTGRLTIDGVQLSSCISGCLFAGNVSGGRVGAVYLRGMASTNFGCEPPSQPYVYSSIVQNSVFVGNEAYSWASAMVVCANAQVENCVFAGNHGVVKAPAVRHSLQCTSGCTANRIVNCIFWSNSCTAPCEDVNDPECLSPVQIQVLFPPSQLDISYSCVQDFTIGNPYWQSGGGPLGMTSLNPQFVDLDGADGVLGTADDQVVLNGTSPCIDSGNSAGVSLDFADVDGDSNRHLELVPTDCYGFARIVDSAHVPDTGAPVFPLGVVDIGAYERSECLGDFNGDRVVNVGDLNILLGSFGQNVSPMLQGDMTGDGFVSTPDLSALVSRLSQTCH